MKNRSEDLTKLYTRLLKNGLSISEIAEYRGVDRSTVHKSIVERGLYTPTRICYSNDDLLLKCYREKKDLKAVVEATGMTRQGVLYASKRLGIRFNGSYRSRW